MAYIDFALVQGDPAGDFLEQNPELKFLPFVQRILDRHKTRASKVLWSLYLVEDPKSKIYHALIYEQRVYEVEKTYSISYVDDCVPYKDEYINAALGPHERMYKRLNDKFQNMILEVEVSDLDDSMTFFAKLEPMAKSLASFEEKYVAERETQNVAKHKGGQLPGLMFNDKLKEE